MKRIFLLIVFLAAGSAFLVLYTTATFEKPKIGLSQTQNSGQTSISGENGDESPTTVAQNLDTPWGIAFLPNGDMLVTERPGRVRLISPSSGLDPNPVVEISSAQEIGEGGLLGIVVHPDFSKNNYIYLYYTYEASGDNTLNRVVRVTYKNNKLESEQVIVDKIPGASNHNGGRIKFGPDGNLYIGTGDAQEPSLAQNKDSLAGKILRVTDSGKPASGNPFGTLVYSYGHRNVQGLAWDSGGRLWATEHGSSTLDEVNLVEPGKNYGWPTIQGNQTRNGMQTPIINSGDNTWAPAGAAVSGSSVFFTGLRGNALYEAKIQGGSLTDLQEHFKNEYGRLRDVVLGPDDMLYVATSNNDGRGVPRRGDDKIIKIDPQSL